MSARSGSGVLESDVLVIVRGSDAVGA